MQQLDFWIRKRASQSPHKIALIQIETGEAWTYAQLMKHTYWWSEQFTGYDLKRGDRIASLMENSIESFAILFACRLNELIFVPLNTKLSKTELQGIVEDCCPSIIIADDVHMGRAEDLGEVFAGRTDDVHNERLGDVYSNCSNDVHEARTNVLGNARTVGVERLQAGFVNDVYVGRVLGEVLAERVKDFPKVCTELAEIHIIAAKSEELETATHSSWQDDPKLLWLIIYTGGTTGKAKGVVLSYEAVTSNAINTVISWGLTDTDCTLNYMPLFHTGGINALSLPVLLVGGTVVIGQKFDAERAVRAIDEYKTTISLFVPTMYQLMTQTAYFEQSTFPTVKVFLSGGAPCPKTIYERFLNRGLKFKEGYGLTEAGPNNFVIDADVAMTKKGAVGKSMLFNEVQVMNENGEPCSEGEVGELWLKGSHVFCHYWNNEQDTKATFHNGWLKTGDLAKFDKEGDFYIVGRKKEMIITGGENVYPQEVEQCLITHPSVQEVTVIGVPDEKWGECVVAFVVLKVEGLVDSALREGSAAVAGVAVGDLVSGVDGGVVGGVVDSAVGADSAGVVASGVAGVTSASGTTVNESAARFAVELVDHCKNHLASYKVPKRFNFVEELPKTVVGKIDKKQLQQVALLL